MRDRVTYEWCAERTETESGDALDLHFADTFAEAQATATSLEVQEGEHVELVLVRNMGNDLDGITDRQFAYLKDGRLPELFSSTGAAEFETETRVPVRFHQEVGK